MSSFVVHWEGSLADLRAALPPAATPEDLQQHIPSSWTSRHMLNELLDWHDIDFLVARGRATLSPDGAARLTALFEQPPFGIEPYDFGYWGSLPATDVAALLAELESTVGSTTLTYADYRKDRDVQLPDRPDPDDGLRYVLLALREVTVGRDVIVYVG